MSSYDEAILAAKALSSKKGLDIQIIKIADVSVGFVGDNGVFFDLNNSIIAQADGIFIADAVN